MKKVLMILGMAILASLNLVQPIHVSAEPPGTCWTCSNRELPHNEYRCEGVADRIAYFNCSQSSPYDCTVSGWGCNVGLE